jgi:uncharacterized phiE125 gp8 family phage protein
MLTLPWVTGNADRDRITAWRTRTAVTRVIGPDNEPVDLAFAKLHGVVPQTTMDGQIELRLRAAREWAERYTGRAFLRQTWDVTVLDGDLTHPGPILLPVVPAISVVSVTSYNAAGTGTVMSSAGYFLDKVSVPARLLLVEGTSWPSGLRTFNSLVVRYLAGYGTDGTDAEQVPESIRHAILLLGSEFNERLEAATDLKLEEVPFGIRALLDPYRVSV